MKVLVVGAGIFGSVAAYELAKAGHRVLLIERERDFMQKASRANHNRLHLGYHYLRSIHTAQQSIEGFLSFFFNFGEAVATQFDNHYAIAREGSLTTPEQFIDFCRAVGIAYDSDYPAPELLNRDALQGCFRVPEPIFDYTVLKAAIGARLFASTVERRFGGACIALARRPNGGYRATLSDGSVHDADVVINATYDQINVVNGMLGVPPRDLLFEHVVIPNFRFAAPRFGLTVMDGRFCSVMPRGMRQNEFLLYHVQHSVLAQHYGSEMPAPCRPAEPAEIAAIYSQSSSFMPFLSDVSPIGYYESIRAVRRNDDDARLSQVFTYEGLPAYFAVLSGKITTCVQVALEIKHTLASL